MQGRWVPGIALTCALLVGCESDIGFQGGRVPVTFAGISKAVAVSPQSVQLSWEPFPGATRYKVYASDKNEAIAEVYSTTTIFTPSPLDQNRTYQYSVTAVDPSTGKEVGSRTAYASVKLLPHFNFLSSGSAVAASKTAVRVNWTGWPGVTYKVYLKERSPTGTVNYSNFVASTQNVTGASSLTVTGLEEGKEYCAVVVAAYADSANGAPDGTIFTTEIAPTLSSAAWMTGPSGTFGDSKINTVQKCARTQSDFSITNIRVYAPKATLSSKPTFYVDVPGDVTEDTVGPVETSIYQFDSVSRLATFIGKRVGTGKITATAAMKPGRSKYFALLTDLQGSARAQDRKEIIVGTNGTTPADETARKWVYVRSFEASEDPTMPTGYYPSKQQAGLGSQRSGSSVAMGDFNCDGRSDLAVGVPDATLMAADNRPAKQGKVIVYYDVSDGTPNTTSRVSTIVFDITGMVGDPGRDLRLGTNLFSGNFNRDNQVTNQYGGSSMYEKFQCDDLAIASGYGPLFVLYGRRDISGPNGGLNYTNATTFTQNPSSSCDPSTNVCEPAVYTVGANLGLKMASGDYNGDGYPELVATSVNGVQVFRGSEFGLIPPAPFSGGGETVNYATGPYPGFPYLPASRAAFAAPTPAAGWGSSYYSSVAPLYNAYYDIHPTDSSKGTKRVRDILLVGFPQGNGVVVACRPETDFSATPAATFSSDPNLNLYWNCANSISPPTWNNGTTSVTYNGGFGVAMSPIKNALRYQPNQFKDCNIEGEPNCTSTSTKMGFPGAVAIGATGPASVFIYYFTANPSSSTTRDQMGAARNVQVSRMFAGYRSNGSSDLGRTCSYNSNVLTTLCVETDTPCKTVGGGVEYCDIQRLTHPTSGSGYFGTVISTLAGNDAGGDIQAKSSILAVAAPNKSLTVSGGITYTNVGSVQLYMQNNNFSTNPIIVRAGATNNCTNDTDGYCRFSTGFSNTLTTSIDYDGQLANDINFGGGGIASGPLEPGVSSGVYSNNTDLVIGAPGHVSQVSSGGGGNTNVYDNGAALVFFSHGGTYRSYRRTETGPSASPWHLIERSFSQESDIKFHLASSIGDLNADGFDDIAVRINSGSRNRTRIYYGRSDRLGFTTAANTYQDIDVQGDLSAGRRFIPLGKITNGQFNAYLIVGGSRSYIYFAGITGLIQGSPSDFGLGGVPRRLSTADPYMSSSFGGYISYLSFADQSFPNMEQVGNIDSTLNSQSTFVHGDFNGDGKDDVAMTMLGVGDIADLTKSRGCTNNYCATAYTANSARVMVFYGGNDNGFQTQPDANGLYPVTDQFIRNLSSDDPTSVMSPAEPCSSAGTGCKIQMLTEGTSTSSLSIYGDSIAAVPVGNCLVNGNLNPVHALVVHGYGGGSSKLYVYKPKCLNTAGNLSGLTVYNNEKKLVMPTSSSTMGSHLMAVKNMMGSASTTVSHLVATDSANMRVYVYPVKEINGLGVNFGQVGDLADGGRTVSYGSTNMMSGLNGQNSGFGNGLSDVGDINGDGFGDVGINLSTLTRRDVSTQVASQGGLLVLFGSSTGLQTHASAGTGAVLEPSRDAFCYTMPSGSQIESICNPALLYAPQPTNSVRNGAYERSYLSPFARLNFGNVNENLGTFLLGVPGRDSLENTTSQRILNGGAFYVLP